MLYKQFYLTNQKNKIAINILGHTVYCLQLRWNVNADNSKQCNCFPIRVRFCCNYFAVPNIYTLALIKKFEI